MREERMYRGKVDLDCIPMIYRVDLPDKEDFTDKWVYGWLLKDNPDRDNPVTHIFVWTDGLSPLAYPVNPDSVGQNTGLKDKNGNDIYEGDILSGLFLFSMPIEGVVVFRDGAFGLETMRGNVRDFTAFTSICNVEWEVIGNVYNREHGDTKMEEVSN